MTTAKRGFTRREFLRLWAVSVASAGLPWPQAYGLENPRRRKTLLSFYCDDTSPYVAGAKTFQTFLDFCAEQQIAGESSCILGMTGHSMARNPNEQEQAFLSQVQRAWKCGIDSHLELMTHHGLFDFQANREPEGVVHEGLWLYEPAITEDQYGRYISADGKSGIIVRHVQAGAPNCVWYSHWQGLNPAKGVGWRAFTTVVERIRKHLGDRVVWMRPSDITSRYHQAGGWDFRDTI